MQLIKIKDIHENKGQIEGVPSNPRQWKRGEVAQLAKSIQETPELFELRPIIVYDNVTEFVVLGGNMRLAAAKHLGRKEVPCEIVSRETSKEKLKEIVIKDNASFGAWDFDALANEWDDLPLTDWGVKGVPDTFEGNDTTEINSIIDDVENAPLPTATNYDINNLFRKRVNSDLLTRINNGVKNGDICPQLAEVLTTRVSQYAILNFDYLAAYYNTKATELEKELMRKLFLIYITPKTAIEQAILLFREGINDIIDDEITNNSDEE